VCSPVTGSGNFLFSSWAGPSVRRPKPEHDSVGEDSMLGVKRRK